MYWKNRGKMMIFDSKELSREKNAELITGCVVPRPIAFVTTINHVGKINAAPFCFFSIVSIDPPMLSISCMRKKDGQMKDTAYNIWKHGEFVVHIVDNFQLHNVVASSKEYPYDVSEAEEVGLHLVESNFVSVPSLKSAKIKLECELYDIVPLKTDEGKDSADILLGRVKGFNIDDSLLEGNKLVPERVKPICRLDGEHFSQVTEIFQIKKSLYHHC